MLPRIVKSQRLCICILLLHSYCLCFHCIRTYFHTHLSLKYFLSPSFVFFLTSIFPCFISLPNFTSILDQNMYKLLRAFLHSAHTFIPSHSFCSFVALLVPKIISLFHLNSIKIPSFRLIQVRFSFFVFIICRSEFISLVSISSFPLSFLPFFSPRSTIYSIQLSDQSSHNGPSVPYCLQCETRVSSQTST